MHDKKIIKLLFLEGKTLNYIAKHQGLTSVRIGVILKGILSKDVYLKQLDYNRRNREHKTRVYKRTCPICDKEFSGKEYLDKPVLICHSCRKEERKKRNLIEFICKNCGKIGTYKIYKKPRVFCDNFCKGQFLGKLNKTNSIIKK